MKVSISEKKRKGAHAGEVVKEGQLLRVLLLLDRLCSFYYVYTILSSKTEQLRRLLLLEVFTEATRRGTHDGSRQPQLGS